MVGNTSPHQMQFDLSFSCLLTYRSLVGIYFHVLSLTGFRTFLLTIFVPRAFGLTHPGWYLKLLLKDRKVCSEQDLCLRSTIDGTWSNYVLLCGVHNPPSPDQAKLSCRLPDR